ncbi:MAG: AI-2E family transporter [Candidatus Marinimicrobia bacterium]|nr:AI-2E family transporter [Candidatus Neomarinimicrobiota bacterium]
MLSKLKDQSNANRYLHGLYILLATVITIFFLKELSNIFIPLFLAIFFSFLFGPLISFLARKKVPNFVIMLLLLIIVSVVLFLLGTVVYASVNSFANEFPKYQDKLIITFNDLMAHLKIPVEDAQYFFKDRANLFQLADKMSLQSLVTSTMGSFLDFIVALILMILLMMFMVAERKNLSERLEAVLLKYRSNIKPGIVQEIQKKIQTYVSRKTVISLGTAISAMIIASFFKMDFIIIIGLITFILNFVPSIGSIIATIFPLTIYLLQYGFGGSFIFVTILLTSSQFLFGNVLDPRYLGHGLKLSPLFIIVSLFFWNWLWGPIGMILCVPLQSIIALILQYSGGAYVVRAMMGETISEQSSLNDES